LETRVAATDFLAQILSVPGGETLRRCIQCGTCTASCPNADSMDYTPSELIAMIRAGMREEVLSSKAPWYCLSCYMCTVRCPRGVKQTDLMHVIAFMAVRAGKVPATSLTPTMYRLFNHYCSMGSLPEMLFMARFYLQTNPLRAWRLMPVAVNLLKRGRLGVKTRKLSPAGASQLRAILAEAKLLGGGS
jgi:heterodisulfide reductase subunit C